MRPQALIVGGLVVFLIAASPAAGNRSEFYGVAQAPNLSSADIDGMASAGVRTDRFPFIWRNVERSEDAYDWTSTDDLVGELAAHGIRSLPIVWGSPDWAGTGGVQRGPTSPEAQRAWQGFLAAAVDRYGPAGSFWTNEFQQRFGPDAEPLPIDAWQIWNEPNLKHFFPGGLLTQRVQRYAELMRISHDAIKAQDPHARVVLGGMAAHSFGPEMSGWDFLGHLYGVKGFKGSFDVAALHPYGFTLNVVRNDIGQFRTVMDRHGDSAKPFWVTEFGWESSDPVGPPAIDRGLQGQAQMVRRTFNLFLQKRSEWKLDRAYWYSWRDSPPQDPPPDTCSFCAMGLVAYDGTPKPAFNAYKSFADDTTPPVAAIVRGPADGGLTGDIKPAFGFASSEAGSTFECAFDAAPLKACSSPFEPKAGLADGPHAFSVTATDAAGNESPVASRSFTVKANVPAAPRIAAIVPKSPANNNQPKVKGSARPSSTIRVYTTPGCTGAPLRKGPVSTFASPGLPVNIADNTTTRLRATAADAAGNTSPCSAARTYVEDSAAPQTTITGGVSGATTDSTPTFTFASSEAYSTFRCRFDRKPFAHCSGPGRAHTPLLPLSIGAHTLSVQATDRAQNTDYTAAKRSFSVSLTAPTLPLP